MRRSMTAAVAGVALTAMIGIGVAAAATGSGPGGRIAEALAGLVSNGTISQEQADAVSKALGDARGQAQADREQFRAERRAEVEDLLQRTLGMSADEVREQLAAGKTLKEIAGDEAEALADGLVGLVKENSAQAVADGHITQERADAMVADARTRADAWLAGEADGLGRGLLMLGGSDGMGPGMMGGRGHHGGGFGPGWDDDADSGDSSDSSTATTATLRA